MVVLFHLDAQHFFQIFIGIVTKSKHYFNQSLYDGQDNLRESILVGLNQRKVCIKSLLSEQKKIDEPLGQSGQRTVQTPSVRTLIDPGCKDIHNEPCSPASKIKN